MVVCIKRQFATEKRSLDWCIANYPNYEAKAKRQIACLSQFVHLDSNTRILEIGAAQGRLLIALQKLGYHCEGVEPSEEAIAVSRALSLKLDAVAKIRKGFAENLPYEDPEFECVIAESVMEHVSDPEEVFKEVFRILKPGGAFYFTTTSSLCPMQGEIKFFPFFSWYPQQLKVKVIEWARQHRPSWIGYTDTPAINWFTPWKAKRMLKRQGFVQVYSTWDVITPAIVRDSSPYKRAVLKVIQLNVLTRMIGYLLYPELSCIAIKRR
jgi:SAM-dependent methyltransferase